MAGTDNAELTWILLQMVDFPIVFLDEAAMCTEVSSQRTGVQRRRSLTSFTSQPVTLVPLMKGAEHVCLIGDHKQLPAVVKVSFNVITSYVGASADTLAPCSLARLSRSDCTSPSLSG